MSDIGVPTFFEMVIITWSVVTTVVTTIVISFAFAFKLLFCLLFQCWKKALTKLK